MDSKTKEELLKIAMAMRKARQWERDNPPKECAEQEAGSKEGNRRTTDE